MTAKGSPGYYVFVWETSGSRYTLGPFSTKEAAQRAARKERATGGVRTAAIEYQKPHPAGAGAGQSHGYGGKGRTRSRSKVGTHPGKRRTTKRGKVRVQRRLGL